MNAYAGLSMSAIIIGYIINSYQDDTKYLSMAFYLFLAISVFTDIHHWYKSWQTSLTGKGNGIGNRQKDRQTRKQSLLHHHQK